MLAVSFLAACSARGTAPLPVTPLQPGDVASLPRVALFDLAPPKCKGQKTTKNYASLTVTLSSQGGSFCIPAYGGYGGSVKYPSASPSVKLTIISSTKNYNHQPHLGKGIAIFYLQLAISSGTTFGQNGMAGGGLTSQKIVPKNAYTAYGQATVFGVKVNFGPCYAIATKGKYGGVIGGIGSLLKGQNIPVAAKGVIELYSGRQSGTKC
jgi:hypothetical protein